MMTIRFVFPVLFSYLLFSCSGESENLIEIADSVQEEMVQRDTVELSWDELEADSAKPGDVLMLNGYIGDIGPSVTQKNGRMIVPLFHRRNQRVGFRLNLNVKIGTRPNHAHELPAKFLPEDFKIVSDENNGDYLTRGSYVSVTVIKADTKSGEIYANLERIYPVKTIGFLPFETGAVALNSKIVHDSAQTNVYCYIEGNLELPEVIQPYSDEIVLDLKNSSVREIKTVDIPLGNSPGTMNDLPDNYTDEDLVIRDYKGSKIPYGSKVRIYGTWERSASVSDFPGKFYVEEIEVIH